MVTQTNREKEIKTMTKIKCENCGSIEMVHCPVCQRILKYPDQPYNKLVNKIHEKIHDETEELVIETLYSLLE